MPACSASQIGPEQIGPEQIDPEQIDPLLIRFSKTRAHSKFETRGLYVGNRHVVASSTAPFSGSRRQVEVQCLCQIQVVLDEPKFGGPDCGTDSIRN